MQAALLVGDDQPAPVAQRRDDELRQLADLLGDVQRPGETRPASASSWSRSFASAIAATAAARSSPARSRGDAERDLRGERLQRLKVVLGEAVVDRPERDERAEDAASTRSGRAAMARTPSTSLPSRVERRASISSWVASSTRSPCIAAYCVGCASSSSSSIPSTG